MSKARSSSGPSRPSARRTVHSPLPRTGTPPPTARLDPPASPAAAAASAEALDDEATDDLPPSFPEEASASSPSSGALRIALNRPISLADVRAVQTEQTALASEATYVGPPSK